VSLGELFDAFEKRTEGDYAVAEPLIIEAVGVFEKARLRISTRGGLERVGLRGTPLPRLAAVQIRLGRISNAWRHSCHGVARRAYIGTEEPRRNNLNGHHLGTIV